MHELLCKIVSKLGNPDPVTKRTRVTLSILLLKSQMPVTVTRGVSMVGVAGWTVILTGWPAGR